jgi:DNA-binding MarR family transcriptional regulator
MKNLDTSPQDDARTAALADLIGESVRLHGRLLAESERMARELGLTGARWQLLSVIGRSDTPYTVSDLARWMGLARQSVQRVADALAVDGLVEFIDNPRHRRAALVGLTARGRTLLGRLDQRRFRWATRVGNDLDPGAVAAAIKLLATVRTRLGG